MRDSRDQQGCVQGREPSDQKAFVSVPLSTQLTSSTNYQTSVMCVLMEPSKNPTTVTGTLVCGLYFPLLFECVKKKWLHYGWTSS